MDGNRTCSISIRQLNPTQSDTTKLDRVNGPLQCLKFITNSYHHKGSVALTTGPGRIITKIE